MRIFVLVIALASGCGGGEKQITGEVTQEECTAMRDHLVDLRIGDTRDLSPALLAQHRQAMTAALGDAFIADCVASATDDQLSCVRAARDTAAVTECTPSETN